MTLASAARALLESDAPAHVVMIDPDGSPPVALVWVGLDGEEIVGNAHGVHECVLERGTARLTQGGAAGSSFNGVRICTWGPDVRFPAADNPPAGMMPRVMIESTTAMGQWTA
jgi:hypothetical protein